MQKLLVCLAIVVGCLAVSGAALAAGTQVTLNQSPEGVYYPSEFDILALDFTITPVLSDTLKSLTVSNLGTARNGYEITKVILWKDSGTAGFQGMNKDIKIAEASWDDANNYWYWNNLNLSLTSATRFYVSLETNTHNAITLERSVQLQIPARSDANADNSWQLGDSGIFLSSGQTFASNLINDFTQIIRPRLNDGSAPKAVITDPINGQTYNVSHYLIRGVARDQGESGVDLIEIYLNGQPKGLAVALEPNYATWEYNWTGITAGTYKLEILAKDGYGNVNAVADSLNLTIGGSSVTPTPVNYSQSTVSADKTTISANSVDKATVLVTVKNQDSQAVAGKAITVNKSAYVVIKMLTATTDSAGKISFEATCSKAGTESLQVLVDTAQIGTVSLTCTAVTTPTTPSTGAYQPGDLIKASLPTVYYYGANGKRYVFPTLKTYLTWYSDFSKVKTISDTDLAGIMIGGNVTYKPGVKMIKITTDPKVYAVGQNGTLHWVTTETVAQALYGANWSALVEDVQDAFFTNYTVGTPINQVSDFDKQYLLTNIANINIDKGL